MSRRVSEAVERGDVDELIGLVNGLCLDGDWDDLTDLARLCRSAIERGHQLWPAAAHADYRLALEAPARWAGPVVAPGRGRFAAGPLAEVAASTHAWAELAPGLPDPALAAVVAQERVLRGEDLTGDASVSRQLVEVPLVLQSWEPVYALATYGPDGGEFPAPAGMGPDRGRPAPVPASGQPPGPLDPDDGVRALRDLVATWSAESSGQAEAVVVEGGVSDAATALGVEEAWPLPADDALAWMAWCAASGGAHGRRRGAAAGRFGAWWAAAAVTGFIEEWPPDPDRLGAAVEDLQVLAFEVEGPPTGWRLGLALANDRLGLAWAVAARDPAVQ